MKNFYCLTKGLPVVPLVTQLHIQSDLWDQNNLRTTHPGSPHTKVSDIWLRFNEMPTDVNQIIDDKECIFYPAWDKLPDAQALIFDLMRVVKGTRLGRCVITKMKPGATIDPHRDEGAPATYYERFHIMLQNAPGAMFDCGDESVYMEAGSAWWFNNTEVHAVVNNSDTDRITMIVDIGTC